MSVTESRSVTPIGALSRSVAPIGALSRTAAPFGAIALHRLTLAAEQAIHGLRTWRRARATARSLAELSDQQLTDIGLARGQIDAVAAALAARR